MDSKHKCKQCGQCCSVFEIGALRACETFHLEVYEHPDFKGDFFVEKIRPEWAPDWAKQGVCMYLTQDMKCSIYEHRPRVCRSYTCRDEQGKIKRSRINSRRKVSNPRLWTEYEREMFMHFLTEQELDKFMTRE